MVPVDIVGKIGRALTEIGANGRVEVDGWAYEAMTSRSPIPAGDAVVVSGWRLVGESTYVLSVRRPGDDAPATDAAPATGARQLAAEGTTTVPPGPPPQYPPGNYEQRLRNLERQLAEQQRYQAGARGTIALGAGISSALGLLLGLIMHQGPGLGIYPLTLLRWAAAGAAVGVLVHLVKRPDGEKY